MKNKKTFSGILIFAAIIIICITVICLSIKKGENSRPEVSYTKEYKINTKNKNDYIAALYIEGEITQQSKEYNQKWLLSTIEQLTNDDKNIAIAVYINSPGGAVYQTDEVYLALQEYKNTERPVYIYQAQMAASGGYYISCAGSKIYANKNTITGSIGVIAGQSFDMTEMLKKIGIKSETIHSGRNKNMGNFNEPLSQEQKAILQSIADESYDDFVSIVSLSRKIPLAKVREIADGRIYTAKQAKELKLIDKISSWDVMINDLEKELEIEDAKVLEFKVPQSSSFMDIFSYAKTEFENQKLSQALGLPNNFIKQINGQRQYPSYLYEF